MNWKNLVEKENARTFVLPKGWDSRDTIAAQLECSPERVRDHLRPAIKSGKVKEQQFKVWDANLKRNVMVTAYAEAVTQVRATVVPFDLTKAAELKRQGKSYAEIGMAMGVSGESVRSKLRRAS